MNTRIPLIIVGLAIVITALLGDLIGLSQPGGFGLGQLLVAFLGLIVLLAGLLGNRVAALYRGTAILLLNTVILFTLAELGSIMIARLGLVPSYRQELQRTYDELPYYAAQEWSDLYWREAIQAEAYIYEPYVVWRHAPYSGETVTINQQGVRQTPGTPCSEETYKVFTFGGSTMWGWGSPDWGTIPAYLQLGLEELIEQPVCVINYGEDGFVSSQSLVELLRQLQIANVPDLVIFYDGVNDVFAAYESGEPGAHVTLASIAAKYEQPEHPLIQWLKSTRTFSLLNRIVIRGNPSNGRVWAADTDLDSLTDGNEDRLSQNTMEVYLNNYQVVDALSQEYEFDYYFFWQPHLALDMKSLTEEEKAIRSDLDLGLARFAGLVYGGIQEVTPNYQNLWYIADVFAAEDEQIWIDVWGHVTPMGNQLIAQRMMEAIESRLAERYMLVNDGRD